MAIEFLLNDAPGIYYYKGEVDALPATAIPADVYKVGESYFAYIDDAWIEMTMGGGGITAESDPIYSADKPAIAKIYHTTTGEPITKSLAEINIGEDMSGASIQFDQAKPAPTVRTGNFTIIFTNGWTIGPVQNNTGLGVTDDTGAIITTFYVYTAGTWTTDFYTLGNQFIMQSIDYALDASFMQDALYTTNTQTISVDPEYNFNNKTNEVEFLQHRSTDMFRWQDTYDYQFTTIQSIANARGMKLDLTGAAVITSYNSQTNQYHITNELGGVLLCMIQDQPNLSSILHVNNEVEYSSSGLMPNIPIKKYFEVSNGSIVYNTNMAGVAYYPYTADPSSQMQLVISQLNSTKNTVLSLQNQINDLGASVQNKTIANQSPIDATNTTFTVDNALGARLSGQGVRTVSLLGITILSTGTVDVNPAVNGQTRVYDNTSLLGIGAADVLSINIPDGTVVTSSGMEYVDITYYVPGTI